MIVERLKRYTQTGGTPHKHRLFRAKRGVSLVEVLLVLALSVVLVLVFVTTLTVSNRAFIEAEVYAEDDDSKYSGYNVLERYIRECEGIAVREVDGTCEVIFTEVDRLGTKITNAYRLYVAESAGVHSLVLDVGTDVVVIQEDIAGVQFVATNNGLGYRVKDKEGVIYNGFSYKRAKGQG